MDIKKLFYYVNLFHKAILETKNELSIEFNSFPAGSCGLTCLLLGYFLEEKGFNNLKIRTGEKYYIDNNYEQEYSHSWLILNNSLVIDITAYQFSEITDKIIIQESPLWYKGWNIVEESNILNIFNNSNIIQSDIMNYKTITSKIQQMEEK